MIRKLTKEMFPHRPPVFKLSKTLYFKALRKKMLSSKIVATELTEITL